jgi:predicted transcriptional regulator of viral defense system
MSGPRAGEVLGAIVRLLPQRESWTVAELKQTIDERGIPATPREVYNAVSYLARKGHIRRVGYGRYLIDGVPVVTADHLGGQPSITEGDSDD